MRKRSFPQGIYHSCFVFGKSRVQISVRRPVVLTEGSRGFLQYLHINAVIVLKLLSTKFIDMINKKIFHFTNGIK